MLFVVLFFSRDLGRVNEINLVGEVMSCTNKPNLVHQVKCCLFESEALPVVRTSCLLNPRTNSKQFANR